MKNIVGKLYDAEYVLGIEDEVPESTTKTFVPRIEDIRVIVGNDGEEYINCKDLAVVMRKTAMENFPTLSVYNFVKAVFIELITARR